MKVKVIKTFRDKFTKALYTPGTEIELDEKGRIADLESRGLVEAIIKAEEPEEKPAKKPRKKTKK